MSKSSLIVTLVLLLLAGIAMLALGLQSPANPMAFILGFAFIMASIVSSRDLVLR